MKKVLLRLIAALSLALIVLAGIVVALNLRGESGNPSVVTDATTPAQVQAQGQASGQASVQERAKRGAYLAIAGNCAACHTARGGAAFAGGSGISTPFGTIYSSNLTPDAGTGIGNWSSDEFWRALHNGRSKDGHLLYPAFPYTSYTQVTRDDSDALYAYLKSLAPVVQATTPNTLRFPYNLQASLAVWRALFFTPKVHEADAARSAEWNRGSYLVRGLGHCSACHAGRNLLGATSEALELSGGLIPMQNWYAPSLNASNEAGVADWSVQQVVDLLKAGRSDRGSVMGPMAEVVYRSTQHMNDADLRAMAVFLKDLPQASVAPVAGAAGDSAVNARGSALMDRGEALYGKHCAACHGDRGQGATGAYPPLAGNRAVTMPTPANLVKLVVSGGYLPATDGNPRPYGMPPFGPVLDDADVAAVVTHVRGSWGNKAAPVSSLDVLRVR